ncbi:2-dehydropantoate 2-reductase (Ketopantoate reductase) (KPA reductase) (KPR), partial [Elasticomyces elasticus]
NGVMLSTRPLLPVQRLLISEISLVIRGLPELEGVPNARLRFSPTRLEALFRGIARKTAQNSSSMREDIRNVRGTEIDYINGYIVKRGEEQGIRCVLNYMICQMVKSRNFIDQEAGVAFRPYGIGDVKGSAGDGEGVMLEDGGTAQG